MVKSGKAVEDVYKRQVLGYVPELTYPVLTGRHLGLVLPEEIPEVQTPVSYTHLVKVLYKAVCHAGHPPGVSSDGQ